MRWDNKHRCIHLPPRESCGILVEVAAVTESSSPQKMRWGKREARSGWTDKIEASRRLPAARESTGLLGWRETAAIPVTASDCSL